MSKSDKERIENMSSQDAAELVDKALVNLEAVRQAIDYNRLDPSSMDSKDLFAIQYSLGSLDVVIAQLKSRIGDA